MASLPCSTWRIRPPLSTVKVAGFVRRRQASYVAVHLPFRWWFRGLDTEVSKLDVRRQTFFAGLRRGKLPDKLIVATPEPTTVFRKRKADDDRNVEVLPAADDALLDPEGEATAPHGR